MKEIYVATTNQGKLKEFQQLFNDLNLKMISLVDAFENVQDVEETGTTFEENARLKADTYCERYQVPVLADDSGLVVDALNGEPGVYTARYAGLEKDDQKNIAKLLKNLSNEKNRQARFISVIAFARPGEDTICVEGRCEGSISQEPNGENGFGYDPVFRPEGYDLTFAQLCSEEKNKISHRRKALVGMLQRIRDLISSN